MERAASVAYSAVLHSSTNPKFCADPTVARKQLTVKWRIKGINVSSLSPNRNPFPRLPPKAVQTLALRVCDMFGVLNRAFIL